MPIMHARPYTEPRQKTQNQFGVNRTYSKKELIIETLSLPKVPTANLKSKPNSKKMQHRRVLFGQVT
jgi:hypothetical protein